MYQYLSNKILSFLAIAVFLWWTLSYFGPNIIGWQVILLGIVIFGHGHFFLGFFYQLRGFLRHPKPKQQFITFIALTLFSVGLVFCLTEYFNLATALFVGFVYFLFHGLFNEQTLAERQTGERVPIGFFYALLIFILGLVFLSLPDKTFFFDRSLQFLPLSAEYATRIFETNYASVSTLTTVFWGSVFLSSFVLIISWWRHRYHKLTVFMGLVILLGSLSVVLVGVPAYIYLYLFVVGYHFMTWFIYYVVEMRKRGTKAYWQFIFQNVVILVPLVYIANQFFLPYPPNYVYVIFDYSYFVLLTYIHISTSFMNDTWLQNLQAKVFTRWG